VPEETVRVARAAFRTGNLCILLRDQLGAVFKDDDFADLFPKRGQPAYAPWRLALITLLQFREGLSDRQAAEAVRARIDWKYLLGLDLDDPGFDHSVLCEFRGRLLAGQAAERLLARVVEAAREGGLLKTRGRQRTDSTHVLAAVRELNRIELVAETLRAALNAIAVVAPGCPRSAPSVRPTSARSVRTASVCSMRWMGQVRRRMRPRCPLSPSCAVSGRATSSAAEPAREMARAMSGCARPRAVAPAIASNRPTTPRRASGRRAA
jgi:transposase